MDNYSGTYIVLMRADSVGPIEQQSFQYYDEAKQYYYKMSDLYHFVKLCLILEDSRDI